MRRICEDCQRSYDDIEFSTICPHDHIAGGYCRRCDLFHQQYGPDCLAPRPTS